MRKNSTSNKHFFTGRFSSHLRVLAILILLVIFLASCGRSTPPGPNSIWGTIEQTNYLLLDWPEGMRILIWDDIFPGEHHNHTESSTNDPVFHLSGNAQSADGLSYKYSLGTRDGLQADFTINGIQYDLEQGKLFLIRTAGGATQVEQLDLDLSGLSPTNAGIEAFGRQTPQITAIISGSGS
ncbi:MAG: hypothetical protein PVH03_10055 [Chloroflexota bacterium]